MPSAGLFRRSALRVSAWLAAGATVPLLGVLSAPWTTMPGSPRSDLPKHVWSYWHTLHHLSEWPETTAIGSPYGGDFLDVMLVPSVVMAPFTALLGPVAAANIWVWLSVFAVGAATAALALRVVGSERSAVVAGLMAQAAPYLAGYGLGSGVHERLAIWVFPVVWLGLLSWRDQGRYQSLWAMALGLFVATVGCQVYGVFTLCMVILGLPWWWPGVRRIVPALAALGAPLLAALMVVRGPTVSARSLVPQHGRMDFWPGMPTINRIESKTVRDLLDPSWVAQQEVIEGGDELYMLAYVGWAVLVAALIGAWRMRGPVAGFTMVAVAMASVSLGAVVQLGGTLHWNPVYLLFSYTLPVFRTIPVAWQAMGAVVPLLAVAAAASVDHFRGPWMPGALVTLVVLERLVVVPVPWVLSTTDTTVSAVYTAVDGPVLEIPRIYRDTTLTPGEIFLAQMAHGQDIAVTINAGTVPFDRHLPTVRGVSSDWHRDVACWARFGYRNVVVHRDWLSTSVNGDALVEAVGRAAGPPVADDGVVAVFQLPAQQPSKTPWRLMRGTIEVLMDGGMVGGPPPMVPHPAERCPAEPRDG